MADKKFFIYTITNTETGKRYVGSTTSTTNRWKAHRYQLNKGIHSNEHLQRAWNFHGKNSFVFEIVHSETGTPENKRLVEDEFMNKYNARNRSFGYNLSAANLVGNVMLSETRKKISAALTNNPKKCREIVQYDIESGCFIANWPSSMEIKRQIAGISQGGVIQCCRHNKAYTSVKGFGWAYSEEYFSRPEEGWANPNYVPHFKTKVKERRVVAKNAITGAILEFKSIQSAADHFGCANKYIQRGVQMSGTRGRKTCKGHTWSYADTTN